jgi:hypothetical protein
MVRSRPCRARRWWALPLVLVLALVASACDAGGPSVEDDPAAALREAFEALAGYDGVELRARLVADDAAQTQALEQDGLEPDDLEVLLSAQLVLRATMAEGDEEGEVELVVELGGGPVAELRVLEEQDLYLRLDLERLIELFDDPEAAVRFEELAGAAEAFGLRDAVDAVRAGEWVRVTGVEQLLNLFGVSEPVEEVDEETEEQLAEELSAALVRFLDRDVEVSYVGEEDAGERVRMTTDGAAVRRLADDLTAITSDAVAGADAAGLEDALEGLDDDTTVVVDAWLDGGRLSQLALDLTALDDEGTLEGELLLAVAIDEFTGDIDAPEGSVEVDLFGIIGGFLGGFGGPGLFDDGFDGLDDGPAVDDGGVEDEDLDLGDLEGEGFGERLCFTDDELEAMRSQLDPDEQAEFDEAIELGILPVC